MATACRCVKVRPYDLYKCQTVFTLSAMVEAQPYPEDIETLKRLLADRDALIAKLMVEIAASSAGSSAAPPGG